MLYEFKKIFLSKIVWIGLLALIVYSIYYSYTVYVVDLSNKYQKVEDIYYGEYTEEKFELISKKMESITEDNLLFFRYLDCYTQAMNYKEVFEYRNMVLDNAKRLKNSKDSYIAKVNTEIENKFSKTPILKITDNTKIKNVTNIFYVIENIDVINVIIIIIMVCSIFIVEHTTKIHTMIFSSYGGRLITYSRKVACVMIFSFSLSVITSISISILTFGIGDLDTWFLPVQNVEIYKYSPDNINLLQWVIILTILRGIGYMTIGTICIVVTIFFKRSIFPVVVNCTIMIGGILIYRYYSDYTVNGMDVIESKYEIYNNIKNYSVFGLLNDNGVFLEKYDPFNILGRPVTTVYVNVCINILLLIIVAIFGYGVYRRKGI